ncbi:LysR substrate-binding domain-containing protein [Klebsiella sp. WOUb02]|uniref:LysR substrate-binding domain-containing protein n=2 Tax=Klebsiella sp. WOUb02 TaxID=3161071 RepID=UPI003D0136D2
MSGGHLHVLPAGELPPIRAAATEGMGSDSCPPFVVKRRLSEGKLVEVLPGISAAELAVHVIYPSRRHLPARVRTFIDELRRYLNSDCFPP